MPKQKRNISKKIRGLLGRKMKGFTIPELLAIITIIAILALLVTTQIQPNRARTRDTKRITEVNTIRKAVQIYYLDKGHYPRSTVGEEWCSVEEGGDNPCPDLASDLEPYLSQIPQDPLFGKGKETGGKLYSYQYVTANNGGEYKIHADLEAKDPYEVCSMAGGAL